jgi:uncharacterized membrane protein
VSLHRTSRIFLLACGVLPVVTWAAAAAGLDGGPFVLAEAWFDLQCHNLARRSFALLGEPLPVCTRCLGIYLGLGAAALSGARLRIRWTWLLAFMWIAAALIAVDVLTESAGWRPASAPLRFLTGALFALAAGWGVLRALQPDVPREGLTT